jgi:hypothetical protein
MFNAIMRCHYAHISSQMPPRIRLRTAYHEAGHGYFMSRSPLWKNVRLSLNAGGGLTRGAYNKRESFSDAEAGWLITRMTIAGAAAEQYFFGNYSRAGAARDVENAIELISGRESILHDYIESEFLPMSLTAISAAVPQSTSPRTQGILGGALISVARDIVRDADKIRRLGKLLYNKSYLSDREVRAALE